MSGAVDLSISPAPAPARPLARAYYSGTCVLAAALAMVATIPGRSAGLGMATESLLRDLHLSRLGLSHVNLWATLLGAGFALGAGRLLDRFGARTVLTILTLSLGGVVMALSRVTGPWGLLIWVTLTRGLGQSALSAASIALVGKWFVRRAGFAMAAYSIVLSLGFIPALEGLQAATEHSGWRVAWFRMGLLLAAGAAPLLWALARDNPESVGLAIDAGNTSNSGSGDRSEIAVDRLGGSNGASAQTVPPVPSPAVFMIAPPVRAPAALAPDAAGPQWDFGHLDVVSPDAAEVSITPISSAGDRIRGASMSAPELPGHTLRQALSTPAFWALALGGFMLGAAFTGLQLFNESILKERGFTGSPVEPLGVMFLAGLVSNFLTGVMASFIRQTRLMGAAMLLLALSLLILPRVHTHGQVIAYAAVLGISAGMVTVVFFACWGKLYGRRHLGKIQGAAQTITVLASAVGPIILAESHERTHSYAPAFYLLTIPIAVLGVICFVVPEPAASGDIPQK